MKTLFCLALCLFSFDAFSITHVFVGNINENLGITLALNIDNNNCTGKYCYNRIGKDIVLTGKNNNNEWVLEEAEGKMFKGGFSGDFSKFSGTWLNAQKNIQYGVVFTKVSPIEADKISLDYQKVKQFQTFLLEFDKQLQLPLKINNKLKNISLYSKEKEQLEHSELSFLSYNAARTYIMNQTKLSLSDYFNRSEDRYNEAPYRAVGQLFSTDKWVAVLLHLEDDNGWDEYEITFGLVFDYEGKLLSEWKTYCYFIAEKTGEISSEKIVSTILSDYKIEQKSEKISIKYGTNPQTKKEYYDEKNQSESGLYQITKEGKWLKIK